MHKKALSDVVTTVLVILIAMAGVIIIWNFMQPFLANSGIDTQKLTASLDIPSNSISLDSNENLLSLNIERNPGEGDIAGFIFGLQDPSGLVKTFRQNLTLYEYETKNFTVNYSEFPLEDVVSITVTPIFRNNKTQEEIYGIPITQPVKNKTFKIPSSLIAYWKFDEAAGATTFVDSEGDYDGKNVSTNYQMVSGKKNNAIQFNGNSQTYINITNSVSLNPTSITISTWIKTTNFNNDPVIITKSGIPLTSGWQIDSLSDIFRFRVRGISLIPSFGSSSIANGNWHHIATTFNQGNISIYLDGNLQQNYLQQGSTIIQSAGPIQIGKTFGGQMDEVMIFDEALTSSQVNSLYKLQK